MTIRPSRSKKIIVNTLLVGPLTLALVACGDDGDSPETQELTSVTGSTAPPAKTPSGTIDPEVSAKGEPAATKVLKAVASTALESVPGATLVSIDHDVSSWGVNVVTADGSEHEMQVAADGGSVMSGPFVDQQDAEDVAEHRALVQADSVDYLTAVQAALSVVPQGRVSELDLEFDGGVLIWDAKVIDAKMAEQLVRVDGAKGTVLGTQLDD